MTEFILNSAGTVRDVRAPSIEAVKRVDLDFCDLDAFTQGYIEAMFFTECEPGTDADSHDPETQSALHGECGFADLAPEALAHIIAQCAAFQADNATDLDAATGLEPGSDALRYARNTLDSERLGNLFWYARNGHGVTFHDDALPLQHGGAACLYRLQDAARKAGEAWVYLGDDGRVYPDGGFVPPAAPAAVATAEA